MKYVAIFCVPSVTMDKWMQETPEAERKAQNDKMMQDWQVWMEKHKASIVDQGLPLGKAKRVSKSGAADARNDLNYMMIVEAESPDAAAALFADNPHLLMIPD